MTELGGVLPDPALQVKALTRITRSVLSQHSELAFRVNLTRASLQLDLTPDNDKVSRFHAQVLSELESVAHRVDKDKDKDKDKGNKDNGANAVAKVKRCGCPVA